MKFIACAFLSCGEDHICSEGVRFIVRDTQAGKYYRGFDLSVQLFGGDTWATVNIITTPFGSADAAITGRN